jgi:CubicO group peptidase (beta-lactamase class C family)
MHNAAKASADKYFGTQGPGMSVGLVLDDGLYYSAGFGFRDSAKTARPDEYTVFRAGSLSKVITGTALLTLIDDPNVKPAMSLGDLADSNRYLPELKSVCPTFNVACARGAQSLGIQLQHLVSHTSGLPNVMTYASHDQWLADLQKTWLRFPPGSFAAYSGVAVEGVGLIEERISGKSYVQFVHDNLLAPLGMSRSTMDETLLPASTRAQKWSVASGLPANVCEQKCNQDEKDCKKAVGGGGQALKVCIAEKVACVKDCPVLKPTWWFTMVTDVLPGDLQPMFRPAGSLATTVDDLASFIAMWLVGTAPQLDGHPMLKKLTIQKVGTSLFNLAVQPPANCSSSKGTTDSNNFAFSPCTKAAGVGVNWFISGPVIMHNGSIGVSGSDTRVNLAKKMGATGLVSTESFPNYLTPKPAALDGNFMTTVVNGLLTSGVAADAASGWSGATLADGVARVLWLSGKAHAPGDLGAFSPNFVTDHKLTNGNVVAFLDDWHDHVGTCTDFRVRDVVSATKIEAVLTCEKKKSWDIVLTVSGQVPHRIAWTEVASLNLQDAMCFALCSKAEATCMGTASNAGEKQSCVTDAVQCKKQCN